MARVLVTGKYVSMDVYILYKQDGTVYKELRNGDKFFIEKDTWRVEKTFLENSTKIILVCRKYSKQGEILREFKLLHNQKGLWATTASSANNNIFYEYIYPKNKWEAKLSKLGVLDKIVQLKNIDDIHLLLGGDEKKSCSEYKYITDAYVKLNINDKSTFYEGVFNEGTYLISYEVFKRTGSTDEVVIEDIFITKKVDFLLLVKIVEILLA